MKVLTKRGTKRLRKVYKTSVTVRNAAKVQHIRNKHSLRPLCPTNCRKMCSKMFQEDTRQKIHDEFWSMNKSEQKIFLLHTVTSLNLKRRRPKDESKKKNVFIPVYFKKWKRL